MGPIVWPAEGDAGAGAPAGSIGAHDLEDPSRPFRLLEPAEAQQCSFAATDMLNMGGCTYGTPQERLAWRTTHMGKRQRLLDPMCCSRQAKYSVAGDALCALHAGQAALAVCLAIRLEP